MIAGATKRTEAGVGVARGPVARAALAEIESGSRVLGRLKRELAIWQWRRSVPSADLGTTKTRKG